MYSIHIICSDDDDDDEDDSVDEGKGGLTTMVTKQR